MMNSMRLPLLLASALVLAFVGGETVPPAQAQSASPQTEQTPQQSDKAREQDRSRAEDVKIGRDWKAQGGDNNRSGPAAAEQDHQTIGRDWRAHPNDRDP